MRNNTFFKIISLGAARHLSIGPPKNGKRFILFANTVPSHHIFAFAAFDCSQWHILSPLRSECYGSLARWNRSTIAAGRTSDVSLRWFACLLSRAGSFLLLVESLANGRFSVSDFCFRFTVSDFSRLTASPNACVEERRLLGATSSRLVVAVSVSSSNKPKTRQTPCLTMAFSGASPVLSHSGPATLASTSPVFSAHGLLVGRVGRSPPASSLGENKMTWKDQKSSVVHRGGSCVAHV